MATIVKVRPHGAAVRAAHWGTALLVLSAWVVGSTMEEIPRGTGRARDAAAYSLGVLVLGLAAPGGHGDAPGAARPDGCAAAQRAARPLGTWPDGDGVRPAATTRADAHSGRPRLGEAREVLANLLLAATAAHALAALWHHFVLRDGALSRTLRGGLAARRVS
jgi:cytochrome b561